MGSSPILVVFQKLLELCRRCARNGLQLLLRIFSLLAKRAGLRRSASPGNPKEERSVIRGGSDVRSSSVTIQDHSHAPSPSIPTERAVVLACSSAPITPPRARGNGHTRTRSEPLMSIEGQLASNTPTLVDSPTSESGYDMGGRFCSSPERVGSMSSASPSLGSIEENKEMTFFGGGGPLAVPGSKAGAIVEGSETCAEPAGMGSKEGEGRRKKIRAIAPSDRPRYDRGIVIKSTTEGWKFKPLETYDLFRDRSVDAWKHLIHPEGLPYYLYKSPSGISFITEANLQVPAILEEVETFMNELEGRIENFDWKVERPPNLEVVLELQDGRVKRSEEDEEDCWTYYMVDLDKPVVFWIDEYDISSSCGRDFGFGERDHFVGQLDFEYWVHIEQFPNHRDIPMKWFAEALGVLNHWRIDITSSADSTCPYDQHDLNALIGSVHHLESTMKDGYNHAYALAGLARMMSVVANERHLNMYGCAGARLQVWQSVRGQVRNQRSWLVKYLSPLLFYAPETHLSGLEKQWVDGVLQERRWKKYQLKLERDWESFVITSTVLLNANVALLSTPIIFSDNGDDGILFASPAAVASQVSIVTSIASIIIGLLLVRQIRISSKDIDITAIDAVDYLSNRKHQQLGLETMAIQYSLPYALLMWGMVTFLTSIAISCFFGIDGWPNTLVKFIYAISWLFIIPLILWTVITGWETNNHKQFAEFMSRDWWLGQIKGKKGKLDTKKFWAWFSRQKPKGKAGADTDAGAIEMGRPIADTPEPITPTNESEVPTISNERRNWRVRVKNFGPVRRLTLAFTQR